MLALALGGKKWPSFSADSPSHDDDNNNNNNPRVCFRKRSSAKITSSESTRTICMPARLACLPARSWRLRNLCQRDGRFRPASQTKRPSESLFWSSRHQTDPRALFDLLAGQTEEFAYSTSSTLETEARGSPVCLPSAELAMRNREASWSANGRI